MDRIKHLSPIENPEGPPSHLVKIEVEDKKIGEARMEYYGSPFPLYYISDLRIKEEYRGQRYGSQIMAFIEEFLKKKGRAGILLDAIIPGERAQGMYERRGWMVFAKNCLAYNLPQGNNKKLNDFLDRLDTQSMKPVSKKPPV